MTQTISISYFELITTGILPLAALSFYNFFIYRKIRKSSFMKGRYVGRKFSPGGGAARQQHGCQVG